MRWIDQFYVIAPFAFQWDRQPQLFGNAPHPRTQSEHILIRCNGPLIRLHTFYFTIRNHNIADTCHVKRATLVKEMGEQGP